MATINDISLKNIRYKTNKSGKQVQSADIYYDDMQIGDYYRRRIKGRNKFEISNEYYPLFRFIAIDYLLSESDYQKIDLYELIDQRCDSVLFNLFLNDLYMLDELEKSYVNDLANHPEGLAVVINNDVKRIESIQSFYLKTKKYVEHLERRVDICR